jgi:integrase
MVMNLDFLSDEDRARLIKACAESAWPALHTLVLVAITTGARKGELIRLEWADIDLKTGRALVSETKNDEPRTLPLAGKALEALRALKLNDSARSEYVFPQPSGLPGAYEHFRCTLVGCAHSSGHPGFSFSRPPPHYCVDAGHPRGLAT